MIPPLQPVDYAVYTALLLHNSGKFPRERFVIRENLDAAGSLRLWREIRGDETFQPAIVQWRLKLRGLEEATINDFVAKSAASSQLEPKLALPLPYVLLSEAESSEIWRRPDKQSMRGQPKDGWRVFHERYPQAGGVNTFSRIGFNAQENQALVEVGIQADWLMGHGEMVLLTREGMDWKASSKLHLWIS